MNATTDRSTLLNPRVCFIAGQLTQGGAERQLYYILKSLQKHGANPSLLCLTKGDFWEDKLRGLGISVTYVGEAKSRLKRIVRILSELRRNPPQIIQSQHFFTNFYLGIAGRLLRLPDIGAMRSNGVREFKANGRVLGWFNTRIPKLLAANSMAGLRYAREHGVPQSHLYYLPNVVETDHFSPRERSEKEVVTLISVGRLVKEKRFDRFLSVLAEVKKRTRRKVKGLIVGPPDPRCDLTPKLQQQAQELGLLPEAVEFRGAAKDMTPLYREADICVLTSDFEGTPNVLMEAMSCGLPVVSTKVGGVPEIVREKETGFMADPQELQPMIDGLVRLIENPELRNSMGGQARCHIEINHSTHQLPVFLDKLYRLALS